MESFVDMDFTLEKEIVDWISCFPEGETHLESLGFDCVVSAVNLEALVARIPSLKRLRLNRNITISQLYCSGLHHFYNIGFFGCLLTEIFNLMEV